MEMKGRYSSRAGRALLAGIAAFAGTTAVQAEVDFGKQGGPVNLVVGYQPYYSEAWSGVVVNGKQLWKKYLPAGSTVEFQVGLQGAVIVNAMTGEKQHIGYVGDMPGIAATFRNLPDRGGTDIRIVGVLGTSKQQCNIFLVRNDAPDFKRQGGGQVDGRQDSLHRRMAPARTASRGWRSNKSGIQPKSYLNQNIEVITTNFRAGKLDAAVIWEPTASKIVPRVSPSGSPRERTSTPSTAACWSC